MPPVGPPPTVPPPPHEARNNVRVRGASQRYRRSDRLEAPIPGTNTIPNIVMANVQDQGIVDDAGGRSSAIVRDVVLTLTVKVVADVALNVWVAGTEHFVPVGAPVQLRVADPLNPAPPIEIV